MHSKTCMHKVDGIKYIIEPQRYVFNLIHKSQNSTCCLLNSALLINILCVLKSLGVFMLFIEKSL